MITHTLLWDSAKLFWNQYSSNTEICIEKGKKYVYTYACTCSLISTVKCYFLNYKYDVRLAYEGWSLHYTLLCCYISDVSTNRNMLDFLLHMMCICSKSSNNHLLTAYVTTHGKIWANHDLKEDLCIKVITDALSLLNKNNISSWTVNDFLPLLVI